MIDFVAIPEERMKILSKDTKWEEKLKKFLEVKVEVNEDIRIEGEDPIHVLRAKEIFKAFGRGFDFDSSLDLVDEEFGLEIIELKYYAGKSKDRQMDLKGRVIGSGGKVKKDIEKDTDCKICIFGKTVSIIGRWEDLRIAKKAIEMLLEGSMHSTVYKFLGNRRK